MRANEAEEKQSRTEQECQEVKAEAGRQRALVEEEAHSQRLMVIAKQHDLQLAADEAQAGLAAKEEEVGRLQEEVEGLSQQVIELKVEASRQFEQSDAEMRAFRQVYDSKYSLLLQREQDLSRSLMDTSNLCSCHPMYAV